MLRVRSRSAHQAGRKRSAMMRNQGDHRRPDSGRISSRSFSCDTYLVAPNEHQNNRAGGEGKARKKINHNVAVVAAIDR